MFLENPERIVQNLIDFDVLRSDVVSIRDNGDENAENNRILLASLNTKFLLKPAEICMHFLKNAYFHRLLSGFDPDDDEEGRFINYEGQCHTA